jgi:hypothetical protein
MSTGARRDVRHLTTLDGECRLSASARPRAETEISGAQVLKPPPARARPAASLRADRIHPLRGGGSKRALRSRRDSACASSSGAGASSLADRPTWWASGSSQSRACVRRWNLGDDSGGLGLKRRRRGRLHGQVIGPGSELTPGRHRRSVHLRGCPCSPHTLPASYSIQAPKPLPDTTRAKTDGRQKEHVGLRRLWARSVASPKTGLSAVTGFLRDAITGDVASRRTF